MRGKQGLLGLWLRHRGLMKLVAKGQRPLELDDKGLEVEMGEQLTEGGRRGSG